MGLTTIEIYSPDDFIELGSITLAGYDKNGNLVCRKKGVKKMASQNYTKASLQNDRGIWSIRGRVFNPETGQMEQRTKSTGLRVKDNTKRRAEAVMRETVDAWEAEKKEKQEQLDAGPKFAEYLNIWLEWKKQMGLKPNSIQSYQDYLDTHILPKLGEIPVKKLELADLERFYREYMKGRKVNSARKLHVVIHGALDRAVRDGVIEKNVADRVEFPKGQKYRGASAYSEREVQILLDAAEKAGEPIHAGVTLAVCYGLRRSEVAGLR